MSDRQVIALGVACAVGIGLGVLLANTFLFASASSVEPLATAPVSAPAEPEPPRPPELGTHAVEQVISGDVVSLEDVGVVRLLGVDTYLGPDDKPVDPAVAKAMLQQLVAGKQVTAVCDPATADTSFKDPNGAYLVYLLLEDGVCVNTELVGRGSAVADLSRPYARKDELVMAERDARWSGRGVWAPQTADLQPLPPSDLGRYQPPPAGRALPTPAPAPQEPGPGDVLVTKNGRFHRPSCRLGKGGVPMSKDEAVKKSYLACPECFVSPRVKV